MPGDDQAEEMEPTELRGLVSNPRRQAVPTLRGFAYQAWQSVYRWITLGAGEALFLEGAEDIDVVTTEDVTTIQVKETSRSGSVTLNSEDVLEAIAHCWEHQEKNQTVTIYFHFLTTSPRGHERPDRFSGVKGLDYWDTCKRPDTDLNPLRLFLQEQLMLPENLQEFIANASDTDLREQLIRRISWDTGNEPQQHVEELIHKTVIEHGARFHFLPSNDSLKVVPFIYKRVWDLICQEDGRWLSYADFVRLFDEVTTERVSTTELRQLRNLALAVSRNSSAGLFTSAGHNELSNSLTTTLSFDPAFLPALSRMSRREEVVEVLRARLRSKGVLILRGSTGMGKSTLASLLANASKGSWQQLNMRGLEPQQIRDRLLYSASATHEQSNTHDYLIDDLNFERQTAVYENALAALLYVVLSNGRRVIITTQGELPTRLRLLFELSEESIFDVPLLTEDEIKEIASNYGCPSSDLLDQWGNVINLNTYGHPLLVHARIVNLQAEGWHAPRPDDLFHSQSIEEVREESQRRFQEQIPSESARKLAYRLSILAPYFKRIHALYLGEHPTPLESVGEAFDLLVGPWVERLQYGYYRISPLLYYTAERMFTPQQIKELHQTAAEIFLVEKKLTRNELYGALYHGIRGEHDGVLLQAFSVALKIKPEDRAVAFREIDFLSMLSLDQSQILFPPAPLISIMLRSLQFRVAAELDSTGRAPKVAARWEEELENFDRTISYPGFELWSQFTFISEVILRFEVPISLGFMAKHIVRLFVLRRESDSVIDQHPLLKEMFSIIDEQIRENDYVMLAALRCKQTEDVADFFIGLDSQGEEAAEQVWAQFRLDDQVAMTIVDTAWLSEIKKEVSDWTKSLAVLDMVANLGVKHLADPLIAFAHRAKAIVLREYLNDSQGAFEALDEGRNRLSRKHIAIDDYWAKLLFLGDRYEEALVQWQDLSQVFEAQQYPARTYSYRDAESCAAKVGDWREAAAFASRAEEAARQSSMSADVITGFHADYAFCLWMAGDRPGAMVAFAQTLDMLNALPEPESNFSSYMLYSKVEHAIAWMKQATDGKEGLPQPPAGWFSDPDPPSIAQDLPVKDRIYFWYYLAMIEYKCRGGDTVFRRFEEESRHTQLTHVLFSVEDLRLKNLFSRNEFDSLVNVFAEYAKRLNASRQQHHPGESMPWEDKVLFPLLFAALITSVYSGTLEELPIKKWKVDAEQHGFLSEDLRNWLAYLEHAINFDQSELDSIQRDNWAEPKERIVAALLLAVDKTLDPETRFYADVTLIHNKGAYALWHLETDEIIGEIVSRGWLNIIEDQRFALRSLGTNAPLIHAACTDNSVHGRKKAARILLVARNAVQAALHESTLTLLNELANSG